MYKKIIKVNEIVIPRGPMTYGLRIEYFLEVLDWKNGLEILIYGLPLVWSFEFKPDRDVVKV